MLNTQVDNPRVKVEQEKITELNDKLSSYVIDDNIENSFDEQEFFAEPLTAEDIKALDPSNRIKLLFLVDLARAKEAIKDIPNSEKLINLTELKQELAQHAPYVLPQEVFININAAAKQFPNANITNLLTTVNALIPKAEAEYILIDGDQKDESLKNLFDKLCDLQQEIDKQKSSTQRDALLLAIEQAKTAIIFSFIQKAFSELDIFYQVEENKKTSIAKIAALIAGSFCLSAYGAMKGYTAMMAFLSAFGAKITAGAIVASSVCALAFLSMYWLFEVNSYAKALNIGGIQSKNLANEWLTQLALTQVYTEMAKQHLHTNQKLIQAQTPIDNTESTSTTPLMPVKPKSVETHGVTAQLSTTSISPKIAAHERHHNLMNHFWEKDLKAKQAKSMAILVENQRPSLGKKIAEGALTTTFSSLNGLSVAFLGLSMSSLIFKLSIASLLTLAVGVPIVFGVTVALCAIGFAAGVLVAHVIKKYAANAMKQYSAEPVFESIKELKIDDNLQDVNNARTVVSINAARKSGFFANNNSETRIEMVSPYTPLSPSFKLVPK